MFEIILRYLDKQVVLLKAMCLLQIWPPITDSGYKVLIIVVKKIKTVGKEIISDPGLQSTNWQNWQNLLTW